MDVGLLMEMDLAKQDSRVGRPSVGLRLRDEGAFVFGFDISANSQSVSSTNARLAAQAIRPALAN
jgi:hypothetical protein